MAGAIADLRQAAARALSGVRAIGFSGQMHGAVLIGRDGRPLRPAILHNDTRAYREAAELWERLPRSPTSSASSRWPGSSRRS